MQWIWWTEFSNFLLHTHYIFLVFFFVRNENKKQKNNAKYRKRSTNDRIQTFCNWFSIWTYCLTTSIPNQFALQQSENRKTKRKGKSKCYCDLDHVTVKMNAMCYPNRESREAGRNRKRKMLYAINGYRLLEFAISLSCHSTLCLRIIICFLFICPTNAQNHAQFYKQIKINRCGIKWCFLFLLRIALETAEMHSDRTLPDFRSFQRPTSFGPHSSLLPLYECPPFR